MIEAITSGVTAVVGWVGTVTTAIVSADGALNELLPLVGIGVAVSVTMLGAKIIKGFTWGA